jgi:zinc transport system substrate-binding protein
MDKNKLILVITILVLAAIALTIIIWASGEPGVKTDSENLVVAATIFPLQSIASEIGGERVDVKLIVPSGASPHTFEPTAATLKDLQSVSHIFTIGLGLDDWAVGMLSDNSVTASDVSANIELLPMTEKAEDHDHETDEEAAQEITTVSDQTGVENHHHGEYNPHYWLSVRNGKKIATNVAAKLSELDPEGKMFYQKNLEKYLAELEEVDLEIRNTLAGVSSRYLVTFHDAWSYFARDYDLEIVGTFEPIPGKEPTPQYLKELQATVTKYGIRTIFSEPQLSTQSLQAFLQDMKITVAVLDPLGGGSEETDSFADLLEYNTFILSQYL